MTDNTAPACLFDKEDEHAEGLRDWLIANGVDWNHVVAWPQLEVDARTFRVEMFKRDADGRPELCHGPDQTLVYLAEFEHQIGIDPELLAAYLHTRPKALKQRERDSMLRWFLHHPPAVMVGRGETLIFVTEERMGAEDLGQIQHHLSVSLPGIKVVLVSGVSQVIAGSNVRVSV